MLIAFVADLFAANRKMLEEIRYLQREQSDRNLDL